MSECDTKMNSMVTDVQCFLYKAPVAGRDLTQTTPAPGLRAASLHCSALQLLSLLAFPPYAAPASDSRPAASAFTAAPCAVRAAQHS